MNIWRGLSYVSGIIFHPVLVVSQAIDDKLKDIGSYFVSKNYLSSVIKFVTNYLSVKLGL